MTRAATTVSHDSRRIPAGCGVRPRALAARACRPAARPHRPDTVPVRALLLCLVLAAGGAAAADLPRRHVVHAARPRPAVLVPGPADTPVVVPAVPLAPVVIVAPPPEAAVMPVLTDPTLAPRRGGCRPGFMIDGDGVCRRTGEVLVACDPYGGACRPLPPTPIPYGIGPYLRRDY